MSAEPLKQEAQKKMDYYNHSRSQKDHGPILRWTHIAMDLVTNLPKTKSRHDAIAVFFDRF
jgi:hypothetical protein